MTGNHSGTWVTQYIYGFKVSRGVQVAVNEFGVVRYAGASGKPDAHKAITYEMDLGERMGANHALWLWETRACITYDNMNFKRGVDPKKHDDLTPAEEERFYKNPSGFISFQDQRHLPGFKF